MKRWKNIWTRRERRGDFRNHPGGRQSSVTTNSPKDGSVTGAEPVTSGAKSGFADTKRSNSEVPYTQKPGKELTQTFHQPARAKRGYDGRGRNFQPKASLDDRRRTDQAGGYGFDTFTPLNTSKARILKEVYQSDLIRLPPQAEGPKGPDMSKWCDYHRAKGHDTKDCWTLTNKIERLIKEGYLGRYVEKRKDRGDRSHRRDERGSGSKRRKEDRHKENIKEEEVRGVVTTIAGGFSGGGETSSARRRYARQVMTIQTDLFEQGNNHPMIAFTNEDFRGIQPHQDEQMVGLKCPGSSCLNNSPHHEVPITKWHYRSCEGKPRSNKKMLSRQLES
ncbi:hypothetical protein SESBI_00264 [Sesbania bispinosa]|nr:hypothetical protein SESBI_00264 [Sesbania bispinosa]